MPIRSSNPKRKKFSLNVILATCNVNEEVCYSEIREFLRVFFCWLSNILKKEIKLKRFRSSSLWMFSKIVAPINVANFTGKHLPEVFLIVKLQLQQLLPLSELQQWTFLYLILGPHSQDSERLWLPIQMFLFPSTKTLSHCLIVN